MVVSFQVSMSRMAERPDEKIVADVVIDLGKTERFEQQKADDQPAIKYQWNLGQGLRRQRQVGGRRQFHLSKHFGLLFRAHPCAGGFYP